MKLLTLISFLLAFEASSQGFSYFNFDGPPFPTNDSIFIDSTANPNNVWQIGTPQKSVFSSAYSVPNVIVTDTINHYPTNDTSSFIYQHIAWYGMEIGQVADLKGQYYVDCDSQDKGDIEISLDHGSTWNSILNLSSSPINLSGSSGDWQYFSIYLGTYGLTNNVQNGDTVLIKFSFMSDGIQDNRDGLMFDDLSFEESVSNLEEIMESERCVVKIVDSMGREVQSESRKNTLLLNLYSDGTVEKVFVLD